MYFCDIVVIITAFVFLVLQVEIIKSMLCEIPEDRPEASKVKRDLEEWTEKLKALKTMRQDSQTV